MSIPKLPGVPRHGLALAIALGVALFSIAFAAGTATAASPVKVNVVAPDYVSAGGPLLIDVNVQNLGAQPLSGELKFRYNLPADIIPSDPVVLSVAQLAGFQCVAISAGLECSGDATGVPSGTQLRLEMNHASISPTATGTISGSVEISGSALAQTVVEPLDFNLGPTGPFAVKDLAVAFSDGAYPANQAAAAPSQIDTTFTLFSKTVSVFGIPAPSLISIPSPGSLREVVTHLPPGLIGDPSATALRCTAAQLTTQDFPIQEPICPLASQVGIAEVLKGDITPIYNLVAPPGYPAAFGFNYNSVIITLLPRIRPSDNGIDLIVENTPTAFPLPKTAVTFWGVPADPSHNQLRGSCLNGGNGYTSNPEDACPFRGQRAAFLRTPTSCPRQPLPWSIELDTYQQPGTFVAKSTSTPEMVGCERVPFEPRLTLTPSARSAHAPTGLDLALTVPQDAGPDGLSQADLRRATVTLPNGLSINPASADGLLACSDQQLRLGLYGPSQCPDPSKLGDLEVVSPLLEEPLEGSVFIRSQASREPESGELFRLAIELRSDERGVDIKLPGSLRVSRATGQITATFDELPQLPFESMKLHLKTGPRAPLSTPDTCGTYTTHAVLSSWSGKTVQIDSPFTIDQNCAVPAMSPGFQAGVANSAAGAFSPFLLRVTRAEGEPNMYRIDTTLPEGELAKLAGVPLCPEPAASSGACPPASQIGSTAVGAGSGTSPLYLPQPGKDPTAVYLAGPYKGGPYSLVVEVPAQAGPFDLGTVVVRSALRIDPSTTQVSVESDPLPQIIDGVPVAYRDVRVNVDRPNFTLNPTSCEVMSVNGTIASIDGHTAPVSDRFQAGECANLTFKPKFSASTAGKTSKANGASFHVHLASNEGPHGTSSAGESNIAKVDVQLPVSLPARLTTLQKACTAAQFASNPAGCPAASFVGSATAHTPILASPLSGPAILVSHGGQAFPDLVLVLQGEGVRINLTGHTQIKKGITFSHFETVPDAPVASFDLMLPQGPHSALTTDVPGRNLCTNTKTVTVTKRVTRRIDGHNRRVTVKAKKAVSASLLMPTTLTAQNGAVIHQNTKIAVTGCAKAKAVKHKPKKGKGAKRGG